ncbi:MAG TPA: sigma-54-dependent Fis family transcriptional regulator [Gammaproteobacteria bacterium]|nr:sigma-54-dependent Fis family transcriptional regulator [Gammaproteobacteria bacterium]
MTVQRALIIDDEPDIRELLELTLNRMNIDTEAAADLAEAHEHLHANKYDLCLTDMRLPDGNGIELVEFIQQHYPKLPVAVITAYGSVESAVQALKAGAFDFVSKPVDLDVLRRLVQSALKLSISYKGKNLRSRHELLGDSAVMQGIRGTIVKLARSQAPIYISGESGTGKEMVARLIHNKGPRSDRPFIPVNCGAIPSELMESEFFGHKKGSFTGAINDKEGLFLAASGGTLFLDEIAELPVTMQVKLLRAIQEKAVRPVGAEKEVPVDVRILSATHKDLDRQVNEGHFRQDLYYRIHVIQLDVPPLRARAEDIPLLADHILDKITQLQGAKPVKLTDDALGALQGYSFPGNVRELENILERAMTLCEDQTIHITDLHLPEITGDRQKDNPQLEEYLDEQAKQAILKALERTRYNKTAAAKLLGISFRAFRYRLKKLGID